MSKKQRRKENAGFWGRAFLLPVLMLVLLFSGCVKEKEPMELVEEEEPQLITVELPEGSVKLYFMNEERTKVVSENLDFKQTTVDKMISRLLTALEDVLWTEDEKELITDRNPIREYKVSKKGLLSLRFSSDYNANQSITEVLRRAAIVKTLCQLDGVSAVEFYIGTQPLLNSGGKPMGMLTAEDFIDSTGENTEFYHQANVSVYFANESGDALVESNLKITYDGTVSTERLILEQLME